MAQHKWHKEIKAWAYGAEIEARSTTAHLGYSREWSACEVPVWWEDCWEFRIKPQPKEPQYLYVWKDNLHEIKLTTNPPHPLKEYVSINWKCIGKIKLEVDD